MSVWVGYYYMPVVRITHTDTGGNTTGTDLSKLPYADNDSDARAKGVALKGFYLASYENTMGVKYGTVLRVEF
jgi:hypothetical protein